jgi:hypothetical protein
LEIVENPDNTNEHQITIKQKYTRHDKTQKPHQKYSSQAEIQEQELINEVSNTQQMEEPFEDSRIIEEEQQEMEISDQKIITENLNVS